MNDNRIEAKETNNIERLKELAQHKDEYVRINVAGNIYTTSDILDLLLHDTSSLVRVVAVQNKNCTKEQIKDVLANETNDVIFITISNSPDFDAEIMEVLSHSENHQVRLNVAKNKNTGKNTIIRLLNDKDMKIVNCALASPYVDKPIIEQQLEKYKRNYSCILDGITKNPNLGKDYITKFSKSRDSSVLVNLAAHPNTEESVLYGLSKSLYSDVRRAVCLNSNTSLKILQNLTYDRNDNVRMTAKRKLEERKSHEIL